jgi:hypothetical protein
VASRNYVAELMAKRDREPRRALAFYGSCTYWNDMESFGAQMHAPRTAEMPCAGRRPGEIPRCPFCGRPGFEAPLADFIAAIDAAPELERAAWHWQRGRRCFRGDDPDETIRRMVAAYVDSGDG